MMQPAGASTFTLNNITHLVWLLPSCCVAPQDWFYRRRSKDCASAAKPECPEQLLLEAEQVEGKRVAWRGTAAAGSWHSCNVEGWIRDSCNVEGWARDSGMAERVSSRWLGNKLQQNAELCV